VNQPAPIPAQRHCVACGRPLLPGQANAGFRVGDHVLFGAHVGECEKLAQQMVKGTTDLAKTALKARAPKLWEGLQLAKEAFERITSAGGHHDG